MICNHGNINSSLQRNTTAGQMSTGTIFTRSTRIVSSKTATGSSRSSQSWPRSVALTMWVILRSLAQVTAARIVGIKNKVGKLQLCLTLMMTSQAPLPLIAFLRWGSSSVDMYLNVLRTTNIAPLYKAMCVYPTGWLWCRQYSLSNTEDQQVSAVTMFSCRFKPYRTQTVPSSGDHSKGFNSSVAFCSDPGLFVYCCDFSSTAVELVKVRRWV